MNILLVGRGGVDKESIFLSEISQDVSHVSNSYFASNFTYAASQF